MKLDEAMKGPKGVLIGHAYNVEYALSRGFTVTIDDVDARTFAVLRAIDAERRAYEAELEERRRKKQNQS